MICLPSDAEGGKATPIGHLKLITKAPWLEEWRSTTLGITLAAQYQDKGYGSEAINWALDWAFNYGGLRRVEIGSVSFNERASRLYEKLGFRQEGRLQEVVFNNGKWHDVLEFAMLKREWKVLRGLK